MGSRVINFPFVKVLGNPFRMIWRGNVVADLLQKGKGLNAPNPRCLPSPPASLDTSGEERTLSELSLSRLSIWSRSQTERTTL